MSNRDVTGKTVKKVRPMTDREIEAEGWGKREQKKAIVLEFEDGTILFPVADIRGKKPGYLFGRTWNGLAFASVIQEVKCSKIRSWLSRVALGL